MNFDWLKEFLCMHDYEPRRYDDEDYIPGISNMYRKCKYCGKEIHK